MTIKELKNYLDKLPDEMPICIFDETTDIVTASYPITYSKLLVEDYIQEEDGPIMGKMLFITFENKLK